MSEIKTAVLEEEQEFCVCTGGKSDVKDVNKSETSFVYQSPIELDTRPSVLQVHTTQPLFERALRIKGLAYQPSDKTWKVSERIPFWHNDSVYVLQQIHLHQKSEHVLNHDRHDVEMHMVFADTAHDFIVIAFLARAAAKKTSKMFRRLIRDRSFPIHNPKRYWSYPGSFTTPPFGHSVTWIVCSHVFSINRDDLENVRSSHRTKPSRELHARHGRDIVLVKVA
jgi:carbonic anhydrase